MNEIISVVVPMYNCEGTIKKCINSIIHQTYKNIEIVVVDDGSTDNTCSICETLKEDDDRIVIIKKENGGVSSARNIGIKQSTGKFITFVDADDYIKDNYIETLYKNVGNNDLIISNAIIEKNGISKNFNKVLRAKSVDRNRALKMLFSDICFQSTPWGKLYRTDLVKRIQFNESMRIAEDHEFLIKYINLSDSIKLIPYYGYVYMINEGSLSRENGKYKDEISYCSNLVKKYEHTVYERYAINHYLNIVKNYYVGGYLDENEKHEIKDQLIKFRYNYTFFKINSLKEKMKYYMLIKKI